MDNLIARTSIHIHASRNKVWEALVDPQAIHQYMFDTNVVSDWKVGGPILWKGEWQGKPYEDKGVLLEIAAGSKLQYSHFSPLAGLPDIPENYHTVTIDLSQAGRETLVTLTQDNNPTEDDRMHSEQNWAMMLALLKKYVESASS